MWIERESLSLTDAESLFAERDEKTFARIRKNQLFCDLLFDIVLTKTRSCYANRPKFVAKHDAVNIIFS